MALSCLSSFCSADLGIPSVFIKRILFKRTFRPCPPTPAAPQRAPGSPCWLSWVSPQPAPASFLRDSSSPTFPLRSCPSASFALAALLFFHRLIHSEPAFGVAPPNCSVPREQATQSRSLLPQFGDHPGESRGCAPPRRPDDWQQPRSSAQRQPEKRAPCPRPGPSPTGCSSLGSHAEGTEPFL